MSGLPQGTPLVAWLQGQRWRKLAVKLLLCLRGQKFSVVEELRHGANAPLAPWPLLPRHLSIVHIIAFPLRRHLAHAWASRGFERLSPLGPNDGGGFLLGDAANLPGRLFPVWGPTIIFSPPGMRHRCFVECSQPSSGQTTCLSRQPDRPASQANRRQRDRWRNAVSLPVSQTGSTMPRRAGR